MKIYEYELIKKTWGRLSTTSRKIVIFVLLLLFAISQCILIEGTPLIVYSVIIFFLAVIAAIIVYGLWKLAENIVLGISKCERKKK